MVIKMLTGSKLANMVQRWEAVDRPISCSFESRRSDIGCTVAHVFFLDRLKVAAHVPGSSQLLSAAVFHVN